MKNWLIFLCLLLSVGVIFGCGSTSGGGDTTTTTTTLPSSITITGTAAASAADLAKLGSTALAVETFAQKEVRIQSLVGMGFDEQSVRALDLAPLAAGDATIQLYSVSSAGAYTLVATGTFTSATGAYTLDYNAFDGNTIYILRITKTSATAGRDLVLEFIVDINPTADGSIPGLNLTPQTTLLSRIIIAKVVEELGAGMLDRETMALIQSIVVAQINTLIDTEGLRLSTVRETGATTFTVLDNAISQSFANDTIKKAIRAVRFKAGLARGATDLAAAKKIMKEIFTYITGSPTGIPGDILDSFAQAYFDGTTKKISNMTPAANQSAIKAGVPITSLFTDDIIAGQIKDLVDATYWAATSSLRASAPEHEILVMNPIIQAAFPASTYYGMSTTALKNVNFTVPQIILLMSVGENVCRAAGAQFNPPKFCGQLGLFTGFEDKFSIMHAEIRVEPWEDWAGFNPTREARPIVTSVLTSFVDV
ncbi:MAG: hypothetical protein KJ811_00195, partial [Candidatus Margulisbacteria bacterium]|nr:hypothetical protein [Candidatus Margulisiibacteriota bacterium]